MKQYAYQWRALLLMVLAWGFAGLVHNCVSFLFPYFSKTFQLGTAHNGYLTGTLAFFWTLSILYCGPRADKIGQVKVMVPGLLLGGVALVVLSLSGSVVMLYVFTAIAGFGCGSIVSSSLSFLAEQSNPKYRGLFFGTAQSSFTLIGSAIGSVVFTRLGATSVGWRGCYFVMAVLVIFCSTGDFPRRAAYSKSGAGRRRGRSETVSAVAGIQKCCAECSAGESDHDVVFYSSSVYDSLSYGGKVFGRCSSRSNFCRIRQRWLHWRILRTVCF